MKHTPGPWEVLPPAKLGKHWAVGPKRSRGGNWIVASIGNGAPGDTLNTEEANARLIAAAPDLLAACKMVLDDPGLTESANDVIRAAIAKAESTP